jgi:hypothetical protein
LLLGLQLLLNLVPVQVVKMLLLQRLHLGGLGALDALRVVMGEHTQRLRRTPRHPAVHRLVVHLAWQPTRHWRQLMTAVVTIMSNRVRLLCLLIVRDIAALGAPAREIVLLRLELPLFILLLFVDFVLELEDFG